MSIDDQLFADFQSKVSGNALASLPGEDNRATSPAPKDILKEYIPQTDLPRDNFLATDTGIHRRLQAKDEGPTAGDYGKAFASSAVRGLGDIGSLVGEPLAWFANKVTGTEDFQGKNIFAGAADSIKASMTEGGKLASEDVPDGDALDMSTWKMPDTTAGLLMVGADGLGSLLPSMLPGVGFASKAARLAKAASVAGTAAEAAALTAQAAKAGRIGTAVSAGAGFGMTGGAAAGEVRQNVEKQIGGMTHDQLYQDVPMYRAAYDETGDENTARGAVVNGSAQYAFALSGAMGAVGGAVNQKLLHDFLIKRGASAALGNLSNNALIRAGVGMPVGAIAEGGQELTEKVGQNAGENIGLGRPVDENVARNSFGDVVGGMMVGGPIGAGGGGLSSPSASAATPAPIQPAAPQPNSPLSNASIAGNAGNAGNVSSAGNAGPAASDPFSARVEALRPYAESPETLRALRQIDPVNADELLGAWVVARNPTIEPRQRELALGRLEQFAAAGIPNFTHKATTAETAPTQTAGGALTVPNQNQNNLGPVDPSAGAIPGQATRISGELPGQPKVRLPAPPVLAIEDPALREAKQAADANYEAAFADLLKAEQLGDQGPALLAYQERAADAEARLAEIDQAVESNRQQQHADSRSALLDTVLADEKIKLGDKAVAFSRAIKGVFNAEHATPPSAAELAKIRDYALKVQTFSQEDAALPSTPNELDAAAMGIKERGQKTQQATPAAAKPASPSAQTPTGYGLKQSTQEQTANEPQAATQPMPTVQEEARQGSPLPGTEDPLSAAEPLGENIPPNVQSSPVNAELAPAAPAVESASAGAPANVPAPVSKPVSVGKAPIQTIEPPKAVKTTAALETVKTKDGKTAYVLRAELNSQRGLLKTYDADGVLLLNQDGNPALISRADLGSTAPITAKKESNVRPARPMDAALPAASGAAQPAVVTGSMDDSGARGTSGTVGAGLGASAGTPVSGSQDSAPVGSDNAATGAVTEKSLDDQIADAAGLVGDILGDVFGAKMNITGPQHSAADLLPAMSKLISLLIQKGFKSFAASVGGASNALRANDKAAPFVDQLSARQWKAAYNSIAEFTEGTDSEDMVNAMSAEAIAKLIALPAKIEAAAAKTDTNPSEAQKESENYRTGKVNWNGLTFSIENPKGSIRRGKDKDGSEWQTEMPAIYGRILGTVGADKDHVDVFVGEHPHSEQVWIVNQTAPGSGSFDEHKVMTGFASANEAQAAYMGSFSEGFGPKVFGSMAGPFSVEQLKSLLPGMAKKAPVLFDGVTARTAADDKAVAAFQSELEGWIGENTKTWASNPALEAEFLASRPIQDPAVEKFVGLLDVAAHQGGFRDTAEIEGGFEESIVNAPRGTWGVLKYSVGDGAIRYRSIVSDGVSRRGGYGSALGNSDTQETMPTYAKAYQRMIEGDIAGTRSALDKKRGVEMERAAFDRLALKAGDKLGALVLNDGKTFTAVTVVSAENGTVLVQATLGNRKVEFPQGLSAMAIERGAERAFREGKRKTAEVVVGRADLQKSEGNATDVTLTDEGNIAKGMEAMNRVIADYIDQPHAMMRPDHGWVSFVWGKEGNPAKGFAGGNGVSKIIAKRTSEGADGEAVARKMVEVIALGEAGDIYGPKGGERFNVRHDGHTAVLSLHRFGEEDTWLLTGWDDVESDDAGAGNATGAYASESSGIRNQEGADKSSVDQPVSSRQFATFEDTKTVLKIIGDPAQINERLAAVGIKSVARKDGVSVPIKFAAQARAIVPARIEEHRIDGVPERLAKVTIEVMGDGSVVLDSPSEISRGKSVAEAIDRYRASYRDAEASPKLEEVAERVAEEAPAAHIEGASDERAAMQKELDALLEKRSKIREKQMERIHNGSATRARTTTGNAEADRVNERIVLLRELLKSAPSVEKATPAVVAESLKTGVKNSNLSLKEQLQYLLGEIDKAIAAVPTDEEHKASIREHLRYKRASEQEAKGSAEIAARAVDADNARKSANQIGFVTFDVPGDGKFKVLNTEDRLKAFRKVVAANPGFKSGSGVAKLPVNPGPGSGDSTITDMLEDGELLAARELAETRGKPFMYGSGSNKDGSKWAILYPLNKALMFDGRPMFLGRAWNREAKELDGLWSIVDLETGVRFVSEKTEKEVVAKAEKFAKEHPGKVDVAVAAEKQTGRARTQDDLAADWEQWAEQQEGAVDEKRAVSQSAAESELRRNEELKAAEKARTEAHLAAAAEPAIDYKGFTRQPRGNGSFDLVDGNMKVRVEPMGGDKYQVSFMGAKSSPHLQGEQGAVDWAANYRAEVDEAKADKPAETPPPSAESDKKSSETGDKAPKSVAKKPVKGAVPVADVSRILGSIYQRATYNKWSWDRLKAYLTRELEEVGAGKTLVVSALEKAMTEYARNANGRLGYPNSSLVFAAMRDYGLVIEEEAAAPEAQAEPVKAEESAPVIPEGYKQISTGYFGGTVEKPIYGKFADGERVTDSSTGHSGVVDGFMGGPVTEGAFIQWDNGSRGLSKWGALGAEKKTEPKQERNFRDIDGLNVLRAPVEEGDWFNIDGKAWQARNGYTGRGWALIDEDKKTHPTIHDLVANSDLIGMIIRAADAPAIAAEKELRKFSEGSTDGMKSPLQVTFILRDKSDSFFTKLRGFDSPQAKYEYLQKIRFDLNIPIEIGTSKRFGDQVDLNRALKEGREFGAFKLEPRKGYVLATAVIDLKAEPAAIAAPAAEPVAAIDTSAERVEETPENEQDTEEQDEITRLREAVAAIPPARIARMMVDTQVYDATSNSYVSQSVGASEALTAVREDIEAYDELLACVRG